MATFFKAQVQLKTKFKVSSLKTQKHARPPKKKKFDDFKRNLESCTKELASGMLLQVFIIKVCKTQ